MSFRKRKCDNPTLVFQHNDMYNISMIVFIFCYYFSCLYSTIRRHAFTICFVSSKLIRKDIDVNEHEGLSNITYRHTLK